MRYKHIYSNDTLPILVFHRKVCPKVFENEGQNLFFGAMGFGCYGIYSSPQVSRRCCPRSLAKNIKKPKPFLYLVKLQKNHAKIHAPRKHLQRGIPRKQPSITICKNPAPYQERRIQSDWNPQEQRKYIVPLNIRSLIKPTSADSSQTPHSKPQKPSPAESKPSTILKKGLPKIRKEGPIRC